MFQFYFQNGDFFDQGISIIKDILIPLLITIIGFSIPLIVENRFAKKTERKFDNDQINYFFETIDNVVRQAKNQSKFCYEYAKHINNNPFDWGLPSMTGENDVSRLAMNSNQSLFKAFLEIYGNNANSIKQFQKIFSCIDALYFFKNEIPNTILRARTNNQKNLSSYSENLEKLVEFIMAEVRLIEFEKNTPPFIELREFLNEWLVNYQSNKPSPLTFEYANRSVNTFFDYILNQFRDVPFNEQITFIARKLILIHKEVIRDTNDSANEFIDIFKNINSIKRELIKLHSALTKNQYS